MNERLKELRKSLKLSQEAFGKRLGITGGGVSHLEKGERNITDQMIKAICREYNVNYLWLTEGQEEMFLNIPDTLIDEIALEYKLDNDEKILVKEFVTLNPEHRKGVCTYIKNIVMAMTNQKK